MIIDILCPLYRASDDLPTLIEGIRRQKGVEIGRMIFPVTESEDGTRELAAAVPEAIILDVKKAEFSHSLTRERAMAYATADVVIFLTQDVVLSDDHALMHLASCIDGRVIHAFARQLTKSRGLEKYTREKNYPAESYTMTADDIEREQIKAFYSSDACAAYDRRKFIELGGFDGKAFQVSEDMYFCRKALLAGYAIRYCAESIVTHSHDLTLRQLYRRYYDMGLFFAQNPEFCQYRTTDSGFSLAFYILGQACKHFDIPVLLRWLPDMTARYLGMRKGKKQGE